MIDFIQAHWPYVVIAAFEICSVVFYFIMFRKRGISSDAIKLIISEKVAAFVKLAEATGEPGNIKLSLAITGVYKAIAKYIKKQDQSFWLTYIKEHIEEVLSTPQKKEVK